MSAALVLTLALTGTGVAQAFATPVAPQPLAKKAKKKVKVVFFKARVSSDGVLTPGQAETVAVSHMPRRARFRMAIEPPPTTFQCGVLFVCELAPVTPAPGSPPFRSDGKGAAVVTFVMPSTYNISTDPFDHSTRRPVPWANGQRVHIDVLGVKRKKGVRKIGFGFGRAAVQSSS